MALGGARAAWTERRATSPGRRHLSQDLKDVKEPATRQWEGSLLLEQGTGSGKP